MKIIWPLSDPELYYSASPFSSSILYSSLPISRDKLNHCTKIYFQKSILIILQLFDNIVPSFIAQTQTVDNFQQPNIFIF